uniref:RAB6-interacting golgin n=1 Tax=Anopheles dirus TaxID=7168 RepID=A0A182N209_9DIPT
MANKATTDGVVFQQHLYYYVIGVVHSKYNYAVLYEGREQTYGALDDVILKIYPDAEAKINDGLYLIQAKQTVDETKTLSIQDLLHYKVNITKYIESYIKYRKSEAHTRDGLPTEMIYWATNDFHTSSKQFVEEHISSEPHLSLTVDTMRKYSIKHWKALFMYDTALKLAATLLTPKKETDKPQAYLCDSVAKVLAHEILEAVSTTPDGGIQPTVRFQEKFLRGDPSLSKNAAQFRKSFIIACNAKLNNPKSTFNIDSLTATEFTTDAFGLIDFAAGPPTDVCLSRMRYAGLDEDELDWFFKRFVFYMKVPKDETMLEAIEDLFNNQFNEKLFERYLLKKPLKRALLVKDKKQQQQDCFLAKPYIDALMKIIELKCKLVATAPKGIEFKEEKLEQNVQIFISNFDQLLKTTGCKSFLEVPQLCKIMGIIYQDRIRKPNIQWHNNYEIGSIYDTFVQSQFDNTIRGKFDETDKLHVWAKQLIKHDYYIKHEQLAYELEHNHVKNLDHYKQLTRFGLIMIQFDSSECVEFMHRTVMEYFLVRVAINSNLLATCIRMTLNNATFNTLRLLLSVAPKRMLKNLCFRFGATVQSGPKNFSATNEINLKRLGERQMILLLNALKECENDEDDSDDDSESDDGLNILQRMLFEMNPTEEDTLEVAIRKPFSEVFDWIITRQTTAKDTAKELSRPHNRQPKAPPGAVKFVPPPPTVDGGNLSTVSCVDTSIYPQHPIQQAILFKPLPVMMNAPEDESILVLPNQPIGSRTTEPAIATSTPGVGSMPPNPNDVFTPFKGMSLKDFEQQRKLMEEQNRQKREILHKAIEQHAQKTAAEASKIQEIKSELNKLDSELASDVAILRKQIDSASLHFSNVEKNYLNIENLFLKAKVELHQALEKKEMLTEHLCAIISHNEERKAKRLSELMEKVGISVNGDFDDTINGNSSCGMDGTSEPDSLPPTTN